MKKKNNDIENKLKVIKTKASDMLKEDVYLGRIEYTFANKVAKIMNLDLCFTSKSQPGFAVSLEGIRCYCKWEKVLEAWNKQCPQKEEEKESTII